VYKWGRPANWKAGVLAVGIAVNSLSRRGSERKKHPEGEEIALHKRGAELTPYTPGTPQIRLVGWGEERLRKIGLHRKRGGTFVRGNERTRCLHLEKVNMWKQRNSMIQKKSISGPLSVERVGKVLIQWEKSRLSDQRGL